MKKRISPVIDSQYLQNIKINLNEQIQDILTIIDNTKYGTELTEYYQNINLDEICKNMNTVANLNENITYNRNIILGVFIGIENKNKLEYLYKI